MEKRKYTAPATTVIAASVEAALLAGSNTYYTPGDIIEVSPGTILGGNAQQAASKLKINDVWE